LRVVVYSGERWRLLGRFRARALELLEHLAGRGFYGLVYGSVARGDVTSSSDLEAVSYTHLTLPTTPYV
jgi:hypothetical protein